MGGHALLALTSVTILLGAAEESTPPPPEPSTPRRSIVTQEPLLLAPGQIRTVAVSDVVRVAVGDPEVADVTVVSAAELLIHAKHAGSTSLIIWEAQDQREVPIAVIDPAPASIADYLPQLLAKIGLPMVQVKRESGKIFLVGEVATDKQHEVLDELVYAYREIVYNVTTVGAPPPPPPEKPTPLVKLSVQIFEVNRTDSEKLGIDWSDSLSATQPEVTDLSSSNLFRWGTSWTRSSFSLALNALVERNQARILSEPKLVTASGKQASSFIGVEVPVVSATAFSPSGGTAATSASVEFRQTGVLLKMTPNVRESDAGQRITTLMEAEVSGVDKTVGLNIPVGSQTILVPGFKVRKAMTEVTTASGETIVIAGLLEAEDTSALAQVPALGSLPVIGRLFRSPETKSTQRELVIVVTPEVVGEAEATADRVLALEQALSVAEVTASVDDPRLRYALQIQDRVAKALRYPMRERELNLEGTVKLKLHLFADGTLGQAMVSQSSGIEALDLEALKAAETQAPYPAIPSGLGRDLWLEVPIIFRP